MLNYASFPFQNVNCAMIICIYWFYRGKKKLFHFIMGETSNYTDYFPPFSF